MNKLFLLSSILLFTSFINLYAQVDKIKDQSNAEKFSERGGALIQREFEDVGTINKCKVRIARFQDLIGGQKTNAIRFEYSYASSYSSDEKIAVLDEDEIDGLIKSLKTINDKIIINNPANYTEVSYRSRSGYEAGCYYSKGKWSLYMKLEKYDSNSYIFMEKDDITEFINVIQLAKSKL